MAIERTMVNIYLPALERSITGTIIRMIRFMPEVTHQLQIVGADVYNFKEDISEDFCNTLIPKKDPEEEAVQKKFKEWLIKYTFPSQKYQMYRVFNLVIEGEDAVARIARLMGDIRIRNGITILGKFGFVGYDDQGELREVEFPASAPANLTEAQAQIELFWNKYKSYGGPLKNSINYLPDDESKVERSVVIIKPNAFEASYDPRLGDVIDTISRTGTYIVGAKIQMPTQEQMEEFYAVHQGKHFFEKLVKFMSNKKSLALLYEGVDAISQIRTTALSIIRHTYAESMLENTIHTSENKVDFEREFKALRFEKNNI